MVEEARIQPPAELGRITFAGAELAPPAPRVIGRGDRLYIRSRGSVASVAITIRGRILMAPDVLAPFEFVHVPNSDRSAALSVYELAPGYLMGLQVFVSTGTVRRGQCYVDVGLLRGTADAGNIVEPLIAGYATIDGALGWPGGRLRDSVEGPGALLSITGTDPPAGTEITITVPANARWRIQALSFALTTNAVAGNRRVFINADDAANIFFVSTTASTQAPATTERYNVGAHSISSASVGGQHFIPIPSDFVLPQAYRIVTATSLLDPGDDFSVVQLLVEEWIEE